MRREARAAAEREEIVFRNARAGVVNALRRTLLSDLPSWAPCKILVRENTSRDTDEFVAHRIGMIPFRRVEGEEGGAFGDTTLRICEEGPKSVLVSAARGRGFEPVHGNIPIVDLDEEGKIDVVVHFDERKPSVHARYSSLSGVAMARVPRPSSKQARKRGEPDLPRGSGDGDGVATGDYKLAFETHDPLADPATVVRKGIAILRSRVDDALLQLASQPPVFPVSHC